MKKRKIKLVLKASDTVVEEIVDGSMHASCDQFLKELRDLEFRNRNPLSHVCARYQECFGDRPPAGIPLELVRLKVAYHLLVKKGFEARGVVVPERVLKNYKASQTFNVNAFDSRLQEFVKISLRDSSLIPETISTYTPEKKVRVFKKVPVAHLYLAIFKEQPTAKLSDEKIADKIAAQIGERPTNRNISSYRCLFNAGKITGQTITPAEPLKALK
jgi:hypothetical protein